MTESEIIENLKRDIEFLRDPQGGYIRAGSPYFMALFGRDAAIISWQLLDYDPSIARNSIAALARLQGKEINNKREEEPGKIPHEWHPKPLRYKPFLAFFLPYYGSVDSTPLFVWLCALYFKRTQDRDWLLQYWSNIKAALEWCEKFGDSDGDLFLEYERKNPFGLKHQGWKDGSQFQVPMDPPIAIIEAQGYYYAALESAKELARVLNEENFAKILGERAGLLRQKILEKYWLDDFDDGYFALALERDKKPVRVAASNPGHLLFTGVLDGEDEKIKRLVAKLFSDEEFWTPYGIRTHSACNKDFNPRLGFHGAVWPHDNWIIAQGLKRLGFREEYERIKNALLAAYKALGKIPEFYAVIDGVITEDTIPRKACNPQGWSSGALLNFLLEK
jgi:glycogen debranching enzyme